jgi:hypothetical protein
VKLTDLFNLLLTLSGCVFLVQGTVGLIFPATIDTSLDVLTSTVRVLGGAILIVLVGPNPKIK